MQDITQLWIIDKEAGICIFEQNFKPMPTEINADLVSGFFIALINFAQEMAGQSIEFLQLKTLRIYFSPIQSFVFALAVSPSPETNDKIYSMIGKIQNRFETRFQTILEKGYFGQTSLFDSFATDVEAVVGQKAESTSFLKEKAEEVKKYYEIARNEYNTLKIQLLQRAGIPIPENDLTLKEFFKTQYSAAKGKINDFGNLS